MTAPNSIKQKDKSMIFTCVQKFHGFRYKLFILFLQENIYCGYLLEVPKQGTSVEYPQHDYVFVES